MFDLMYSDELRQAINEMPSDKQRAYFLYVFQEFGEFVKENDEFLTLQEYMRMYCM